MLMSSLKEYLYEHLWRLFLLKRQFLETLLKAIVSIDTASNIDSILGLQMFFWLEGKSMIIRNLSVAEQNVGTVSTYAFLQNAQNYSNIIGL